jgi:hypothetical protein
LTIKRVIAVNLFALMAGLPALPLVQSAPAYASPDCCPVPPCSGAWQGVPIQGTYSINSVSAITLDDAWAVGTSGRQKSILEQFTGEETGWIIVYRGRLDRPNGLNGVAAVPGHVWAVGYMEAGTVRRTFIVHSDGTSFQRIESPNAGGDLADNELLAVAIVSPTDVWAVGYWADPGGRHLPLAEHWDGASWQVVGVPNFPGSASFTGVSAAASTDAWAVGSSDNAGAIAAHWDGTEWAAVTIPDAGQDSALSSVSAVSSSDVWAVGYQADQPLLEHWNGTVWGAASHEIIDSPTKLTSVSVISPTTGWAVGFSGPSQDALHTFAMRWDGSTWSVYPIKSPGTSTWLFGVATVSADEAWTVGGRLRHHGRRYALTERICPAD